MHNEKSVPVQKPAQTDHSNPASPGTVKPSDLPAPAREGTIGEKSAAEPEKTDKTDKTDKR